jgi:hypothetical protein
MVQFFIECYLSHRKYYLLEVLFLGKDSHRPLLVMEIDNETLVTDYCLCYIILCFHCQICLQLFNYCVATEIAVYASILTRLLKRICGPCIVMYLYSKDQQDALFTFSFIPINNLYMFQADLLLIIRRYYSVHTANSIC